MPERYILTLDLGSSGVRAYAVPEERPWEIAEGAQRAYRPIAARSGEGLWRRFAPATLRASVLRVLAEAPRAAGIHPADVSAVAVTAQRGGAAFLDARGEIVYVGPNTDLRAVFEGAAIDERIGAEIYARTGHLPSMFFTPAKLHWWREHHPRGARRIASTATLGAWVVQQLTGELAETPSQLAETGLLDVATREPAYGLLASLGIDDGLLAPLVEEGTPTAGLTADGGAATGLRRGTPVYLAGPDAQAAALGTGCVEPDDTCIAAGWSAPTQRVTPSPAFDAHRRTWVGLHPVPGRWVAEANPGDTGGTVDAVRRLLGARMSTERFDRLAAASEADWPVVASWGPRALDLSSPGMSLGGLLMPVPITFEGIDSGAVARATLENVAFALRECVTLLDAVAPSRSSRPLALTGGMAASALFPRMLADALGGELRLHHPRAGASGATLIASRPRTEWAAAARELAGHGVVVAPDADAAAEADERYERWLRLRAALDALAEEL